jgi:microcin C transport system permease protein
MSGFLQLLQFSPLTRRRLRRFRSIRRGYYSAILLLIAVVVGFCAELVAGNRALVVHYQGEYFVPLIHDVLPGSTFGLSYDYETNYRELQESFGDGPNWLVMPFIPYGPYENDFRVSAPAAPDFAMKHFLGTDVAGRDVLSRLIYGFRIGILFAIALGFFEFLFGITLGLTMGYFGGRFDLIGQRLVEIWSNVPVLYLVIIVASFILPSFWTLLGLLVLFGWVSKTQYMRALAYAEKGKDYVLAARTIGFSSTSIMFRQILPNTVSMIVTLLPFTLEGSFAALTIYDYLGFGLPPPTPSWGELLHQGTTNLRNAPWLTLSVVGALVLLLVMLTFVGEALREAFDPKNYVRYE